tara:strand:- start:858 stop:1244 length:387 start_codon:yes stop_codon:yes gene_type:complete
MFHLPKKYKLTSKKSIDRLFSNGNKIENKVFRLLWQYEEKVVNNPVPFKILVVVPKKNIQLSSTRNNIKRKMRESIRLNKPFFDKFLFPKNNTLNLAIIYQKQETIDFYVVKKNIKSVFRNLTLDRCN